MKRSILLVCAMIGFSALSTGARAGALGDQFRVKLAKDYELKRQEARQMAYNRGATECMDSIREISKSNVANKEVEGSGSEGGSYTAYVITAITKNNMICQCDFSTIQFFSNVATCLKN